jgi:branched-chain amino acid transport system permease protein
MPQPMSSVKLYQGPLILLALVVLLPLLARGGFAYLLPLAQLCGIYALIVTGLTLLMGFVGQISLGHAGFYALGAYIAAVAITAFHLPLWLAIVLAIGVTGLFTLLAGVSLLRLQGHYLALATLCTGIIIQEAINKLDITGGAAGLYDLPEITFFGLLTSPCAKVYFIWGIVVLVLLWAVHLTESPVGRILRAIHGDEDAAHALGIRVFSVKVKIFVASGMLAALAGVLYAFVYSPSYLGPEEFNIMLSVTLVTMVVIGGMGSIWGGLAGAVVLTGLHEVINLVGEKLGSTDMAKYEQLIFGLLLVVILIFSRDGLMPGLRRGVGRVVGLVRR